MIIQNAPDYPLLKSALNEDFLEMVEYSVQLYLNGIIIQNNNGELIIPDSAKVDFVMLDLDAVRWWLGKMNVDEFIQSIDCYYKRKTYFSN